MHSRRRCEVGFFLAAARDSADFVAELDDFDEVADHRLFVGGPQWNFRSCLSFRLTGAASTRGCCGVVGRGLSRRRRPSRPLTGPNAVSPREPGRAWMSRGAPRNTRLRTRADDRAADATVGVCLRPPLDPGARDVPATTSLGAGRGPELDIRSWT